jgi:hypothetical protein
VNDSEVLPFSGSKYASFYAESWNAPTTRLISPKFELNETSNYILKFRHIQAEWEGDQDELTVLIKTQSSGIWEEIAHYNSNTPEWASRFLEIPYSEPLEIAFEGIARFGYGIGIDSVEIIASTPCESTPDIGASGIMASNITKTSMNISWTRGNGDGLLILARRDTAVYERPAFETNYTANSEFGAGDALTPGTFVVYNGTDTQFTLTGLEHTSDYQFAFYEYYLPNYCYENQGTKAVLSTEPTFYDIAVSVRNTDGNLLENARVEFDQDTFYTSATGEATLQVMHSQQFRSLQVAKDEYTAKSARFVPDGAKTIETELRAFAPLTPSNLSVTKDYKTITLAWEPVIHENFDHYYAFSLDIDGWTFIDNDAAPTWGIKTISWPNSNDPMAFMTFNAISEEVVQMDYDISAWSGNQVLISFAAVNVESDDWLISPDFLVAEGDFFSFMGRSLATGNSETYWGPEIINIKIRPEGNSEWITLYQNLELPEAWNRYEYDLADYTGQRVEVAIQKVSLNTFALLLDDLRIGSELGSLNNNPVPPAPAAGVISRTPRSGTSVPAKKPLRTPLNTKGTQSAPLLYAGNVEYAIYRNGSEIAREFGFASNRNTNEVIDCNDYSYSVRAVFPDVKMTSGASNQVQIQSCYVVFFIVKDSSGNALENAEITFNNEVKTTTSSGEAVFTAVPSENNQNYQITATDYNQINTVINVNNDTTVNETMVLSTSDIDETWINIISFATNPVVTEGTLYNLPHGIYQIELFDITGQQITKKRVNGGNPVSWDFSPYQPGIYMMLITASDGKTARLKIIKQRNN